MVVKDHRVDNNGLICAVKLDKNPHEEQFNRTGKYSRFKISLWTYVNKWKLHFIAHINGSRHLRADTLRLICTFPDSCISFCCSSDQPTRFWRREAFEVSFLKACYNFQPGNQGLRCGSLCLDERLRCLKVGRSSPCQVPCLAVPAIKAVLDVFKDIAIPQRFASCSFQLRVPQG